jgi:hypothetical protein
MADDKSDERGVAVIDFLNNGSQSLIMANQKQPLKFYRVNQKNSNDWVGFKLKGSKSNRDAYGAVMTMKLADGKQMTRQVQTTNGYGSQSDDRLHFGLGPKAEVLSVKIAWPSGLVEEFPGGQFALRQYHTLVEGKAP